MVRLSDGSKIYLVPTSKLSCELGKHRHMIVYRLTIVVCTEWTGEGGAGVKIWSFT